MRRRSRLAVTLVTLLTAGGMIVGGDPRGPVLAADPIEQAKAERAEHPGRAGSAPRLDELRAKSAHCPSQLDLAEAELADITAEYERVVGLLTQVRARCEITAQLARLRARIDRMDGRLRPCHRKSSRRTAELRSREALLQDHMRSAYEQSQTSLLEVLLSAPSLDAATNQVGYLVTLSEQDQVLADEIRFIREQLESRRRRCSRVGRRFARPGPWRAEQENMLRQRQRQLWRLEKETARLRAAADAEARRAGSGAQCRA